MKKVFKTVLAATAACMLATSVMSCAADGTRDDPFSENKDTPTGPALPGANAKTVKGEVVTFKVETSSVNAENTVITVKYDRTAIGAKEKISLVDCDLAVSYNGTAVKMPSVIDFALDEYGAAFEGAKKDGDKILDSKYMKEYKAVINFNKKVNVGDTVTVELKSAKVSGEGANTVDVTCIMVSLIDKDPSVSYYKELVSNDKEYQPLITVAEGNAPADTPSDDTPATPADYVVPEVPALPKEYTNEVSVFSALQTGDNVWNSGTKTEEYKDGAYLVTSGKGWDPNGMATMPVCTSIGDADVLLITLDATHFTVKENSAEYPSYEVKVEDENGGAYVINATDMFKDGSAVISLAEAKAEVPEATKFTLNIRGEGTIVLAQLSLAKANTGDTPAAPEDPSDDVVDIEFENVTSVFSALQTGDSVWNSGTKTVLNEDGTYTVTSGTGWDPNGMATMPVCTSIANADVLILCLDLSDFTVREGSAEYPSYEVKVEDDKGGAYVINATEYVSNGIAIIPLTEAKENVPEATKFTLNIRGEGTIVLSTLSLANISIK